MDIITDTNVLRRVDDLHNRYTYALDRVDMAGWLETFSLQGSYELTTQENIKHDLPVGMMLVAKSYGESTIYRAASAFEAAGDWRQM